MKTTSIFGAVLASAAVASAQVKYEDGKFVCETPDASYCAGDSLGTDMIIRCNGKVGQPGRCTNNLAGYPPLGVNSARCYQSSETSGDAACEKNCVVYAAEKSFTLPAEICTPYYTATESASAAPTDDGAATTVTEETTVSTTICPESSSTEAAEEPTTTVVEETTISTTICPESSTTEQTVTQNITLSTTICPEESSSSAQVPPPPPVTLITTTTPASVPIPTQQPPYTLNSTVTYVHPTGSYTTLPSGGLPGGSSSSSNAPGHTPTGPSGPGSSTIVPGAAVANRAAGALAFIGGVAAFLL